MLWNDISKDWKTYRKNVKRKFPKLTEADLDKINGKRETLVAMLKERHGLEKVKAEKEIDAFLKTVTKPAAKA